MFLRRNMKVEDEEGEDEEIGGQGEGKRKMVGKSKVHEKVAREVRYDGVW